MNISLKKYISIALLYSCLIKANAQFVSDTTSYQEKRRQTLKEKIVDAPVVIKICPTAFLFGGIAPITNEYRLTAEITTGRTQSDQISVSYLGKSVLIKLAEQAASYTATDIFKISGYRIQYAHKFYLLKHRKFKYAPTGFYFGPDFSYADAHVAMGLVRYYNKTYYDFRNLNANVIFGVQIAKRNRIALDIYTGLGYKSNTLYYHATSSNIFKLDPSTGPLYIDSPPINALLGISLGYSF